MTVRVASVALILMSTAGCAVLASKREYAAYRATRLARDPIERLEAMQRYIAEYPRGMWARRVGQERARIEPDFYAAHRGTRDGLALYLRLFPDGRFVEEARPRLAALSVVQTGRDVEAERAAELERQRQAALAEQRRTWLTRAAQYWTRTLVSLEGWGQPIAEVARRNPSFSRAFGESPRPRCSRDECIKHYHAGYAIPVPGATRIDRTVHMILRIAMRAGRVERFEMLLPHRGFSRWYEQENRVLVADEDPQARQAAIEWAVDRIVAALREAAPEARPVDVVLDPIIPPRLGSTDAQGADQTGGAEVGGQASGGQAAAGAASSATPSQPTAGEPSTSQAPAAAGGTAGSSQGSGEPTIDELLRRAAGEEPLSPPPGTNASAGQPAVVEPTTATLVVPVTLQGFRVGPVQVAVFAASDDDTGEAYDGVVLERVQPEAASSMSATPQTASPRRRRPR
ncbi:MAG: hypothetical protein NZ898_03530 [Myxococcota bacterium]|nr:hypothetical protein [Myxococcota bacterium]MDW8361179.1 hypothetical protein [Myxococcales bacterium]